MNKLDGPEGDQMYAFLYEKASRLIAITEKLYEQTPQESAVRRLMGVVATLKSLDEEYEQEFRDKGYEGLPKDRLWLPLLGILLLQAADPTRKLLEGLNE